MTADHTLEPIVDPERLFEGFENLMPFRLRKLLLCGTLMQCHPERSGCFAKRSRCGVEGPLIGVDQDECSKAFSQGYQLKITYDDLAGFRAPGCFDCVILRFANDHFAQDDES